MSSKLTVIFYIILCLEAGIVLTLLPWVHPFGLGDWGDNYFLLYASQKIGLQGLQHAVSSGWVRGAVTGLGLINLGMAFWEMAHFRQTVRALQSQGTTETRRSNLPATDNVPADANQVSSTDYLPDYRRHDDRGRHSDD
ncbi:MAG TPA: hypothetical protein VM943_08030 [Pyrinomonadaceae bacterium]|nr:hypothetical protein [Pyrinomonadaceae bacterium]